MKQRTKHCIQFTAVIIMWCFAIVLFMYQMAEAKDKDSKVIIVPTTGNKPVIVMDDKTSTTIMDLNTHQITFCDNGKGGLVICQNLGVNK